MRARSTLSRRALPVGSTRMVNTTAGRSPSGSRLASPSLGGIGAAARTWRRRTDAWQREAADTRAVDTDLDVLVFGVRGHALIQVARDAHANLVLGVRGEHVAHLGSPACAERQAGQMNALRQIVGDAEILDRRRRRRGADGEAAHALGRAKVLLHQRRRHLQHAGDVVEPIAGVVCRQHRRDVEVERQQIADRVAVLGAVQTMERLGTARIRTGGRRAIELAFEPAKERGADGRVRTR